MSALQNMPLAGLRVIDLGQIYQGPYATFLMAKAGADVIKVEPLSGEANRQRIDVNAGASLPFEMLNTNKRCVTLNLKTEEGKSLLIEMVRQSDVLLENFGPGVMDRLGVGWETMREINPRLIYATATGFGLSGPDKDNLAMDLTIQAVGGIIASTGFPDGPPVKAGPAVVDFMGGIHLYAAVMTALVERARTGAGRLVEVAMIESVYPTLASALGLMYESGEDAVMRTGNRHSGLSLAPYNVYRASDGYVAIICPLENHWTNLLHAMGREDLIGDPRYDTHRARVERMEETDALVEAWSRDLTRDEVFAITKAHKVPCAPVRELPEVMHDKHMHERGMLEYFDHPRLGRIVLPNSPIRVHGADKPALKAAAALGEHNSEVYRDWIGLSEEEFRRYRQIGVFT